MKKIIISFLIAGSFLASIQPAMAGEKSAKAAKTVKQISKTAGHVLTSPARAVGRAAYGIYDFLTNPDYKKGSYNGDWAYTSDDDYTFISGNKNKNSDSSVHGSSAERSSVSAGKAL